LSYKYQEIGDIIVIYTYKRNSISEGPQWPSTHLEALTNGLFRYVLFASAIIVVVMVVIVMVVVVMVVIGATDPIVWIASIVSVTAEVAKVAEVDEVATRTCENITPVARTFRPARKRCRI